MAIDWQGIKFILWDDGVFDDNVQTRPLNRNDLAKLIEENGGTGEHIDLRGLDLSGIDIRGMQLGRVWFNGCNLKGALAQPMVTSGGQELTPWDLAYGHVLEEHQAGKKVGDCEVTPTNLEGAPPIKSRPFQGGPSLGQSLRRCSRVVQSRRRQLGSHRLIQVQTESSKLGTH